MYQRTEVPRPAGLNKDLSPYELPPEIWSDGANIHFRRNRVTKAPGYDNPFELKDTISNPIYLDYYTDNVDTYWVYGSFDEIRTTAGENSILLGDGYNATREYNWTGCNFNGLIVMNNSQDHPQVLNPTNLNEMIDLPNWAVPDSVPPNPAIDIWGEASRCEVIRPYKNYLIAMDCYDDTGRRYPSMVRWSSPAESGDVPPSWNPNITGEQAGLYTLADSPGRIVEGRTLGDYFCIYKTDAVWLIQFVGGDFVFSFRKLFGDESGCITKDCVAEFDGKHFVLSPNGAYLHNGSTKQEIMEQWVKDEFFLKVDKSRILETKVVADHNQKEIWIYYITETAVKNDPDAFADRALIYNWETQTWTIRELSGISYIAEGLIELPEDVGIDDWDSDDQSWDADTSRWGSSSPFNPTDTGLLLADYDNKVFYAESKSETSGGVQIVLNGFIERIGIDFNDDDQFKYISKITPHILGSNPVKVTIMASDVQVPYPDVQQVTDFIPGVDHDVDCHIAGRYIGIRFSSDDLFVLTGYTIEWEPEGNY